jgi:hypothetical protein
MGSRSPGKFPKTFNCINGFGLNNDENVHFGRFGTTINGWLDERVKLYFG